jgi:hypothetical protein
MRGEEVMECIVKLPQVKKKFEKPVTWDSWNILEKPMWKIIAMDSYPADQGRNPFQVRIHTRMYYL